MTDRTATTIALLIGVIVGWLVAMIPLWIATSQGWPTIQ